MAERKELSPLPKVRKKLGLAGGLALLLAAALTPAASADTLDANEIFRLTNAYRSQNNKPTLSTDSQLCDIALARVIDVDRQGLMLTFGVRPHENLFNIYQKVSSQFPILGENLVENPGSNENAIIAWQNSPTHNTNLLNPSYSRGCVAISHLTVDFIFAQSSQDEYEGPH